MAVDDKPGFIAYKPKHLPKVNSLRLANSLVNISSVPILERGQVCYSTASSADNEPRSCYNCHFYNRRASSCSLMGPGVRVEKFTYPPMVQQDSKPIEYWPVCGMFDYGEPQNGLPVYKATPYDNPDDNGFGWVNAPQVGLKLSGTSCGGANGGDDCDNYIVPGDDKRAEKTGFCRVLQTQVDNMDCCTAWTDDDWVDWQKGAKLLEEIDSSNKQRVYGPNPLLK